MAATEKEKVLDGSKPAELEERRRQARQEAREANAPKTEARKVAEESLARQAKKST